MPAGERVGVLLVLAAGTERRVRFKSSSDTLGAPYRSSSNAKALSSSDDTLKTKSKYINRSRSI